VLHLFSLTHTIFRNVACVCTSRVASQSNAAHTGRSTRLQERSCRMMKPKWQQQLAEKRRQMPVRPGRCVMALSTSQCPPSQRHLPISYHDNYCTFPVRRLGDVKVQGAHFCKTYTADSGISYRESKVWCVLSLLALSHGVIFASAFLRNTLDFSAIRLAFMTLLWGCNILYLCGSFL
jgi:hypothetical protein